MRGPTPIAARERSVAIALVLAPWLAFGAGPATPQAATPRSGSAEGPIDCPLHAGGVDPAHLRPFAETEEYIRFLDRPERARWQKPDALVAALGLAGDETLADLGAGSGYFTFRFAKALPRGKVVATDVDPEMVRHLHHRVLGEGIENVQVVLADAADPTLPPSADVVFVCDVLHHVEQRERWLKKAHDEMKPGARLVVVEFREGELPEGPPESMKIPRAKLLALVRGAGFELVREDATLLPYQILLVFRKPPAASR